MSARLSLALVFLAAPAIAEDGKRYAVLVGVNDYDHVKLTKLKYAEADATELRDVFKAAGYDATLLATALGKANAAAAPTKANVERAIKAVLDKGKRNDTVVVALAGHGLQFDKVEGAFFCPQDAAPFAEKADTLVSLAGVFKLMDGSGAGIKLMLVDACRDDPKATRGVDGSTSPRAPKGVAALFSCSAGERAYESDKYRHGVFFKNVLDVLRGDYPKAVEDNGDVTWDALQTKVRNLVSDDVAAVIGDGARQTPTLNAGELSGKSPVLVSAVDALLRADWNGLVKAQLTRNSSAEYMRTLGPADIERWRKAADRGSAEGLHLYAICLTYGYGVAKDEKKAAALNAKAADLGNGFAMTALGNKYANGIGVAKDEKKAVELFRKAAEVGWPGGHLGLGRAYEGGGMGLAKDEAKAAECYRKAADMGYAVAMVKLGTMYADGRGVAKDVAEARKWFQKALDVGYVEAKTSLDGLGKK